jgi:hypothetical protein
MKSPFKMNPKTPLMKALVGKQKNLPQHLKQAILDAPTKKTTDPKKKKDNFRYESDAPEVIGTAATKDRTELVSEYKKGGKTIKKGDMIKGGGFQTPKKVVDTGRDASGRKKAGRTGQVEVEVKKGDIKFSTGKKTKKKGKGKSPVKSYGKKTPVKSYGKSPVKMTDGEKKQTRLRAKKRRLGDKAMNFPGEKQVSEKRSARLLDREEKVGKKIRKIRNKK